MSFQDQAGQPHKFILVHMPSDINQGLTRHGSITQLEALLTETADRCQRFEPPLAEQLFQSFAITAAHETVQAVILESSPGLQVRFPGCACACRHIETEPAALPHKHAQAVAPSIHTQSVSCSAACAP